MQNRIDIYKNGVLLPQPESISVTLTAGGLPTVSITATPGHSIAISETDEYDVDLVYEVNGSDSPQRIMAKARAVANSHSFTANPLIKGFADDGVQEIRSFQLVDRFAKFKDRAPSKKTIRKGTTVKRELRYISGQSGMPNIVSLLPDVKIERIEYVPEEPFWSTLQPWLAPWQALEVLDPVRGELRLYNPLLLSSTAPVSNRSLTLSDYNDIEYASTLGDIITQVRVNYLAFGDAAGRGPSESLTAVRRDEDRRDEGDGSKTYSWTEYGELKVDPDDPEEEPRVVTLGVGQTRTLDGKVILEEATRYDFLDNYTRPWRQTTTSKGLVDLPGVGPVEDVDISTVETILVYVADDLVPGRYFLATERTTTHGVYVFPSIPIEVDPEREQALASATPADTASHAGAVSTVPNASQEWAVGLLSVEVTTRKRLDGGFVAVTYSKTDALRKKVIEHWSKIEQGDTATIPQGYAKFLYVRKASSYGERVAATVDGTRIGLPLAKQIANQLLATSGVPSRSLSISTSVPNYTRLRLGYLVRLDVDALPEMAGLWLIREVKFYMGPPPPQGAAVSDPQVTQSLTLARSW